VNEWPFNADEIAAQSLAGGGPRGVGIQDFMPEQHRQFFSRLPYVFVGTLDAAGWPIATALTGEPGFVQAPSANILTIGTLPDLQDPANAAMMPGRDIAILGIDLSTRRRNRANGRILSRGPQGVRVAVSQSFGNCPQYIQLRKIQPRESDVSNQPPASGSRSTLETLEHLDLEAKATIANADTFFVASHSGPGSDPARGADISHRGGRPGFVRLQEDVLTIPDFRGNRYFNTFGNLIAEPRASLLFVDFENGDLLQLQGMAEVDWSASARQEFAGAERLWRFQVTRGWRRKAALSLHWSFGGYSPVTLHTGTWS
jgi:uncharacterized protein